MCDIEDRFIRCPHVFEASQFHQRPIIIGPGTAANWLKREHELMGRAVSHDMFVEYKLLLSHIPSVPKPLDRKLMPRDLSNRNSGMHANSKACLAAATRWAHFPKPARSYLGRCIIEWLFTRRLYTAGKAGGTLRD
eukprot:8574147-Pyramimonas_sp.AAC.1